MPRQPRTRAVTAAQVISYANKANEYLDAAINELGEGRTIASTSLAIHAAINASDALTGARLGRRAAGRDHDEVLSLLGESGADGAAVARDLRRLLPMKTKAEYESVPRSAAAKAVERAQRCVAIARRVVGARSG